MGNENSTPSRLVATEGGLQSELQAAREKAAQQLQAAQAKRQREKTLAEEAERDAAAKRKAAEDEAELARQAAAKKKKLDDDARVAIANKLAREKAEREQRAKEAERARQAAAKKKLEDEARQAAADKIAREKADREAEERRTREAAAKKKLEDEARQAAIDKAAREKADRKAEERRIIEAAAKKKLEDESRQAAIDKAAREKSKREAEARRTKEAAAAEKARNDKAEADRKAAEQEAAGKREAQEQEKQDAERSGKENLAKEKASLDKRMKAAQGEVSRRVSVGQTRSQGSEEGEIKDYGRSTPVSGSMPVRQLKSAPKRSNNLSSGQSDALNGWNPRKGRHGPPSDTSRPSSSDRETGKSRKASPTRADSKEPLSVPEGSVAPRELFPGKQRERDLFPEKLAASASEQGGQQPEAELSIKGASTKGAIRPGSSVKRSAPSSGFEDDRRRPSVKLQKRNTGSGASMSTSPVESASALDIGLADDGNGERAPPRWYTSMMFQGSRESDTSGADTLLKRLKDQITKVKRMSSGPGSSQQAKALVDLRTMLHKLVFVEVTPKLIRNNRMLDNKAGLPQIFDERYAEGTHWPYDIKADSKELYHKWCSRTWETDILRGIQPGKPKTGKKDDRASDRLKPGIQAIPSRYHGNGNLLNGQWWPTQLTCLRDGAHGSSQGGIYGDVGHGAYSVIVAGGLDSKHIPYPDKDEGEVVLYCGTDSTDGKPTGYTQRLIESANQVEKKPVRLIRSHNSKSPYAPSHGFRYDGLYDVVDVQRMDRPDSTRQRHRFKLVRRGGQDPIRGGEGPERRPTEEEIEAYEKDKRLRGYT